MVRLAAVLALVFLVAPAAGAQTTPTEAIQQVFARVNQILTDPRSEAHPLARLTAIRKLVGDAVDFRGAAEQAGGDHWQARTAAEQAEFTWLFADLLERGFLARVAAEANLTGGTRVRYLIEAVDGDRARVMTAMGRKDGRDLLVGYRLVDRNGTWKITDVTLDGVSLTENYRAQLDRVLGTATFPELLIQMRAKLGAPDPAPPTAAQSTPPPENDRLPRAEIRLVNHPPARGDAPLLSAVAPAPPPPRPLTTKAYWLRIPTRGTADEAVQIVARLRNGKHEVGVERTTVDGKPTISVRIGPFADAETAVLELLALQTQGHDPYLIAERE